MIAGSFLAIAFSARADLSDVLPQMNDLERWAIFSLGAGGAYDQFSQSSNVSGDVGVAGSGKIFLTNTATLSGKLCYRSNGTLGIFGNARITGAPYHNQDALLDQNATEAISASDAAFALTPTLFYSTVNLTGYQSQTISGAPGETVVLKLGTFALSDNATFTLRGTATTKFIINVTQSFSLSGSAKIVLSGGLAWNDVLFNVRGAGVVKLSGRSVFNGVLMADNRTVKAFGQSSVNGELIANRIVLGGSIQISRPPIVSP
jgi:choice-of-anchor A domain-containing protein